MSESETCDVCGRPKIHAVHWHGRDDVCPYEGPTRLRSAGEGCERAGRLRAEGLLSRNEGRIKAIVDSVLSRQLDEAEQRIAALTAPMPCGHPGACVVSSGEGTNFCGWCADVARLRTYADSLSVSAARWEDECAALIDRRDEDLSFIAELKEVGTAALMACDGPLQWESGRRGWADPLLPEGRKAMDRWWRLALPK